VHAGEARLPVLHGRLRITDPNDRPARPYNAAVLNRRESTTGLAVATVLLAIVIVGFTLWTGLDWFYPRVLTTVAIMVVVVLATLAVRRLLPRAWRPEGLAPTALACVGAYVFLRLSIGAGWTEFVDHDVLETLEGEVDDFPTWLFAALGGAAVLVGLTVLTWLGARLSRDDSTR
jgi:hypothetical protein